MIHICQNRADVGHRPQESPGHFANTGPDKRGATGQHSIVPTHVLPGVLLLIFAAQCAWFIRTQSFTIDEPLNIVAGLAHWHGNTSVADDNPPAARLLCSVLLLGSRSGQIIAANPDFDPGFGLDPYDVAWRTRSMNVLLGVALGIALWCAAKRFFSLGAASFTLALYAFSPPVIAHFSIVGTDGVAALMIFLTAVQVARFRRDPSCRQTVLTGAVLGALLLAKLYTLPMFALALLLMFLPSPLSLRVRKWRWAQTAAALGISFLLLWACYGFDVSRFVVRGGQAWVERHGARATEAVPIALDGNFSPRLPAADYFAGIVFQLQHAREGHEAFLLGRISEYGWRSYYPIAVALKWPTMVLLLALAVAGRIVVGQTKLVPHLCPVLADVGRRDLRVMALFPAAFFALAIFSTVNIGERYVLAVYPFVLLLAGSLWHYVRRWRAAVMVLVLAAALNAADALRYAPDYLSYFTVFVPPAQTWHYLSDSSLDWGQSLIALHDYQQRHPGEELHVAFWTNAVSPELYGIDVETFGEEQRPTGTVIVSPGVLSGQLNNDPEAYRWVLRYPRKAILNHTLQVFDVPRRANPD
jgi:hypothetical protein